MKRLLGLAIVLATTGCNLLNPSYTIVYTVTGSGAATSASLTMATGPDGSGTSQQDATLPFTSSPQTMNTNAFVYISAQNDAQSGCVTVTVLKNGSTFQGPTQSCGAFVIASASGTIK